MAKLYKRIIEALTTGMYDDSRILFREYIQNAADSIDHAKTKNLYQQEATFPSIRVTLDKENRKISIYDNGTGIPHDNVTHLLGDVASSDKEQGKDKGYKGIGRLGGLAYCKQLKFTTSSKGEDYKTTMIWDAEQLQKILQDKQTQMEAGDVLDKIICYSKEKCDVSSHFFLVELIGINEASTELLEEDKVEDYLEEVVPLPYVSKFLHKKKIEDFMAENGFPEYQYSISLNDIDLFRPYSSCIYKRDSNGSLTRIDDIADVQFKVFYSCEDHNNVLAWMWYGLSSFEEQIPENANKLRGLRFRAFNIQIGNYSTIVSHKFFPESRGTGYFFGEIHVVSPKIQPNARRDYFEENDELKDLESQLRLFCIQTLNGLYRYSSKIRTAIKPEKLLDKLKKEIDEKKQDGFTSQKESDDLDHAKKRLEEQKDKSKIILNKYAKEALDNEERKIVFKKITGKNPQDFLNSENDDNAQEKPTINYGEKEGIQDGTTDEELSGQEGKPRYLVSQLSAYNKNEQKLISKIYGLIYKYMGKDPGCNLIQKINEDLKSGNR